MYREEFFSKLFQVLDRLDVNVKCLSRINIYSYGYMVHIYFVPK